MTNMVSIPDVQPNEVSVRTITPNIGAEIKGLDLAARLDAKTVSTVRKLLLEHKVLFFRNQVLTPEQHMSFARHFGDLYRHPNVNAQDGYPYIQRISAEDILNSPYADEPAGPPNPNTIVAGFHSDTDWRLVPAWASVLRAVKVPDSGGDTLWVDTVAAYNSLPNSTKARLEGLHVTHDARDSLQRNGLYYPIVAHPLVRTHPETGEKSIWVSFTNSPYILGVDISESKEILQMVLDQYRIPEFQVRFAWRPDSIAFWDNRSTVHYGVWDYGDFPRLLHRVMVEDDQATYGRL